MTKVEIQALKAMLLMSALNGVSRYVNSDDSDLSDAEVDITHHGDYIQICVPQQGKNLNFTLRITGGV